MILYTFSEFTSNITDISKELLLNNNVHFSRHQTVLTFPESYWQKILHTFPEFTANKTDIFRELLAILHTFPELPSNNTGIFRDLLAKNTIHFSGFHIIITRYWHFQRVNTKQYWLIQSSYQTVFILSQSYYHFFEMSEWTLEQTENYQTKHFHLKVRKVTNETYNFAVNYSWVYMIGRWYLWKKMA